MGIFDKFKKKSGGEDPYPLYLYEEKEIEELEAHIEKTLGSFDKVFHEIISPDIHLDVAMLPATEEDPYLKLVTMGAGAYKMNVPSELKDYKLEYAEYVILLPKDWNIDSGDEKDYWPTRALKDIARLPINSNTWLGYGHTVQADVEGKPYAENTGLNNIMLVNAVSTKGDPMRLTMSTGKVVNFYLLLPIYQDELEYKMEDGADALVDLLLENEADPDFPVMNPNRVSAVKR